MSFTSINRNDYGVTTPQATAGGISVLGLLLVLMCAVVSPALALLVGVVFFAMGSSGVLVKCLAVQQRMLSQTRR